MSYRVLLEERKLKNEKGLNFESLKLETLNIIRELSDMMVMLGVRFLCGGEKKKRMRS